MIGETVSHFKILEKLGGGMSVVYKAKDLKLDRLVALKFLPPYFDELDVEQKKTARERFVQEAKAASALDHPHIGTIYEIDETEDGRTFIVMAFYEGATLKKAIERGPLPMEEVVRIASQVAQGLGQAHAAGILHRDIKPANVMLTRDGLAKIIDFGLARLKEVTRITERGATLGTLAYMAPEQVRGEELDERADIWALGVVLYEMLAGGRPFAGEHEGSLIHAILNLEPKRLSELREDIPPPLERVVVKALQKNRDGRFGSTAEMAQALEACRSLSTAAQGAFPRRRLAVSRRAVASLLVLLLASTAAWLLHRNARIRWAREEAIPQIKRLADEEKSIAALKLALQAEQLIPTDPALREILADIATTVSIETTPPGADVYMKDYLDVDSEWQHLGRSPIEPVRVPVGFFRWRIEKSGFVTAEGAASTRAKVLRFALDEVASTPRMVRIPGGLPSPLFTIAYRTESLEVPAFLIDKYEVTNREFKGFVDRRGYQNRKYWKHPFIKDGEHLSWEEAMAHFRDATGRPGPATWELGTYPAGEQDYPVGGVSWYEAAAYAEFVGKTLPTLYHWDRAASALLQVHRGTTVASYMARLSNFSGRGPQRVGSHEGISLHGVHDLAGNVREWGLNWNESLTARYVLGGAWSDAPYTFESPLYSLGSFDRSPENGLRCAQYLGRQDLRERLERPMELVPQIDFSRETPVPDEIFKVYRGMYAYDRTELNASVESVDESPEHWVLEKITFDAAYGNERVKAYLFLPKGAKPPYQPLIYFPGSDAVVQRSSETLGMRPIDFVIRSGRAVMYPIYKSTYERGDGLPHTGGDTSTFYRDHVIMWAKDLMRSIDYLETREEIDLGKLTYYGFSWGAHQGPRFVALENRIKAALFVVGGLVPLETLPEAQPFHFAPRVTVPVLMLNGRYDTLFSPEKSALPLFQLLGTPDKDKRLIVYESGHSLPRNASIRDMLDWLDLRLGPVR